MATALRNQRRDPRETAAGGLRLVRARTPDEVAKLEGPWRAWDAMGGCPSSHYGWTRACLKAFADDASGRIVAVLRGQCLSGVAPLVQKRLHGVHRLFLAGSSRLGEPMDLVWSDPAGLGRLVATLARSRSPIVLERMPADSAALAVFARALRGRALVIVRPEASYPHISLDESWVEPEQHLSARRRDELAAARREAERLGPVATEIHTPGLHELPELLDRVFEVEAHGGWTKSAEDALDRAVFYRQYAEAACVDGTLRICLLRIGDHVAASAVAVESGGAFWLLLAGCDPRFAACRPSWLLLGETIRYAAEAALTSCEFWGGTEVGVWGPMTAPRRCVSLRAYPLGPGGLAALVADAALAGWQSWRRVWNELAALEG